MPSLSTLQREDTLDLAQLANEISRREETRVDIIADTRRVGFVTDEWGSHVTFDDYPEQEGTVNSYAHGQIAGRLKIPKTYYDRMRESAPQLLDSNVRHWLTSDPETRMFRLLDGNVRAVLSNRFRRLDNYPLLNSLLPVFNEIEGLKFHLASLTDTKLYLRAILPGLQAEIRRGDVVQAGVQIRNSEVGSGMLSVEPYLWRLICLNGMISNISTISARHTGRRIEESEDNLSIYSQATLDLDDAAFFAKVADLVKATLSEQQFEVIVNDLRDITDGAQIGNVVAASEMLASTLDLSGDESSSVLQHLISGGDLSQWGAVNALTAAAKDAAGFDRVADLEALGGKVAALDASEWSKVALAA